MLPARRLPSAALVAALAAAVAPSAAIAVPSPSERLPARGAAAAQEAVAPDAAAGQEVPTPASVIGWEPGADYKLAGYERIRTYFERVAEASDRVELTSIGRSTLGRDMLLAIVSSPENLERKERYREIARRLASGEVSEEEARRLAEEGKAIVWIDAGLHATEVAHAQHMPKLLYRLATGEDAEVRRMLEDAILLLLPFMNPDGLDIVVDWYEGNLGTPYETAPLPTLYHHYVGHDNNRDWFMMLMPESRNVTRQLWFEWFPQIVYNHHQTGPFPSRIFVPPFKDPMNPHIPPLVMRGINLIGTAMAYRFAQEDKPGVVSRESYTVWWNGGMRTAPYFHNQFGILTETNLYEYATPRYYPPDSLPASFDTGRSTERPGVFYANPWKGGWWRIGDAVDYMMTGSMAVADIGARLKDKWLLDTWRMADAARRAGEEGDPFAYVIPGEQHDLRAATELVGVLRRGGVEVHRAEEAFEADGVRVPAGSWVAYAAQPYRAHLLDLMERQEYPDRRRFPGGPPITPYDLAGWTLPLQMGVDVRRVDAPFTAPTVAIEDVEVAPPPGEVTGSGPAYLLSPTRNDAYLAVNRLLGDGARVERALSGFRAGDRAWPPGTFIVRAGAEGLSELAEELGLAFVGAGDGSAAGATARVRRSPRVGLYKSWVANMDEGWTRWLLERWAFPFATLHDADIRDGDLSRFDTILLPEQDPGTILNGHAVGTMPDGYTGGLGADGAARLRAWVEDGGTLVAMDHASEFAIQQLGLPVENPVAGLPDERFFIPGSLVRTVVDPSDPLAWGMRDTAATYFVRSLAFRILPPAGEEHGMSGAQRPTRRVDVAARYASDDLLMSGWELGAREHLADRPAVVRLPLGRGQVVLTAFRPQFRGQPRGTFKLLFNALLAGSTEGLPPIGDPDPAPAATDDGGG